jgi:hypothetical protein
VTCKIFPHAAKWGKGTVGHKYIYVHGRKYGAKVCIPSADYSSKRYVKGFIIIIQKRNQR